MTIELKVKRLQGENDVRNKTNTNVSRRTWRRPDGRMLLAILLACMLPLGAQQGAKNDQWRIYGGDGGSTRYSPLAQIDRSNVKNLKVAWTWKSDNFSSPPEFNGESTPIMINEMLYFTAGTHRAVVAADAGTGETQWIWKNDEGARYDKAPRKGSGRGVAYWSDGRDERIFTVTPGFRLVALEAKTGRQVAGSGWNRRSLHGTGRERRSNRDDWEHVAASRFS